MIIDSHAHVWQLDRQPQMWIDPISMATINRDFAVSDLVSAYRETGIDRGILVQSQNSLDDSRDLLRGGAAASIDGVVGWIDVEGDVEAQVTALSGAERTRLVGIRHLVHQDPDSGWLARDSVRRGLTALGGLGIPFDLVVRHDQLPLATRVVSEHPDVEFVLDHLGKPPLSGRDLTSWRRDVSRLGEHPNVVAKVSGLALEANWSAWTLDEIRDPVDVALQAFGPQRLMFGSDWPLVELTGGLPRWLESLHELVGDLSPGDEELVFAQNALRVYFGGSRA